MDWYSWLSKSNLKPSLAYEYSLLFTQNELEEEDIVNFNHEFLQSMNISIAKHRLEILKLAKKIQKRPFQPVSRLIAALSKTRKFIGRYINNLVIWEGNCSAIVVVPKPASDSGSRKWKGAMMRRNKRLVMLKQERLMITDEGVKVHKPKTNLAGSVVNKSGAGGGFWGRGEEEIRWDSMFQDLKPT